jgi:hypothetical protein
VRGVIHPRLRRSRPEHCQRRTGYGKASEP